MQRRMAPARLTCQAWEDRKSPTLELANGVYEDWLWLDERIDNLSAAIGRMERLPGILELLFCELDTGSQPVL